MTVEGGPAQYGNDFEKQKNLPEKLAAMMTAYEAVAEGVDVELFYELLVEAREYRDTLTPLRDGSEGDDPVVALQMLSNLERSIERMLQAISSGDVTADVLQDHLGEIDDFDQDGTTFFPMLRMAWQFGRKSRLVRYVTNAKAQRIQQLLNYFDAGLQSVDTTYRYRELRRKQKRS